MTQIEDKPSLDEALEHFGVKGMRWGVRKEESDSASDFGAKVKKGAIVTASVLAVVGVVAVTVAVHNAGKDKEAAKLLQESLSVPFRWKDGAGDWHKYAKEGGLWVTRP